MTSSLRIVIALLLVATTSTVAQSQTVLFDFQDVVDDFLHFGSSTLESALLEDCGTIGNVCASHTANFTESPTSPNEFGIGEIGPFVFPTSIDLSGFIGYSIDARFLRTGIANPGLGQTDFTGLSPIKFGVQHDVNDACGGSMDACSDKYDTPVELTETFQTFTIMFADLGIPGGNDLSVAQIKMLMLTGDFDSSQAPNLKIHSGDFNASSLVDGTDFLTWQQNNGAFNGGLAIPFIDGNANIDANIDGADLAIWESQYGTSAPISDWSNGVGRLEFDNIIGILPPLVGASAVPEPSTFALMILCGASLLVRDVRSKQ